MHLRFKCRCCQRLLTTSYDQDHGTGKLLFRLWYLDERGLKHFAIVCLWCGTIHDGFATTLRSIFTLMRRPLKVINDLNPLEIGDIVMKKTANPSTDARRLLIDELRIPEEVIDVLVERSLLGPAYGNREE